MGVETTADRELRRARRSACARQFAGLDPADAEFAACRYQTVSGITWNPLLKAVPGISKNSRQTV